MPTESAPVPLIVKLQATDLAQLEALLQANGLPIDDCADQLDAFFGVFENSRLVAAGGLEPAGDDALLRSIVVDSNYRSRGMAASITEFFIAEARSRSLQSIYLLTETAEDYFARFGFESVARDQAPTLIRQTRQFAGLCPGSASFMRLILQD